MVKDFVKIYQLFQSGRYHLSFTGVLTVKKLTEWQTVQIQDVQADHGPR